MRLGDCIAGFWCLFGTGHHGDVMMRLTLYENL